MTTVLIITDSKSLLKVIKDILQKELKGIHVTDEPDGLTIETVGQERVYVVANGTSTADDYEIEELNKVKSYFDTPYFYAFHYSSLLLMKKIIIALGSVLNLLVDNDFGDLLPIKEFVKKMQENPDWDWRGIE